MAGQVKIVFSAEESALLRAQKNIIAGEKATAAAMKETARAAEQSERTITTAKTRAARVPSAVNTGWMPGGHTLPAPPAGGFHGGRYRSRAGLELQDPLILAAHEQFRAEQHRGRFMQRREDRIIADARFNGIDTADTDAVMFHRFQRAQHLRSTRAAGRAMAAAELGTLNAGMSGKMRELHAARFAERAHQAVGAFGSTLGRIAGIAGVATGAIAALGAVLADIEAERQGGVSRKTTSAKSMKDLRQIATSQQHLDSLVADVGTLRTQFGIDESAAANAVFSMESAGLRTPENIAVLKQASKVGVNPDLALRGMALMRTNYAFKGDIGTMLGKVLASAAPGMANVDQIVGALGQSAGAWRSIGGGMDDQLAALGVLSDSYKSTDVASERLASIAQQVNKDDERIKWSKGEQKLAGLELVYALPRLAAEGKLRSIGNKKQTVDEWLSESQAIDAFNKIIGNRDAIDKLRGSIGSVRDSSTLAGKAGFTIAATDASGALARQSQNFDMAVESDATLTAFRDAVMKNRRAAEYAGSGIFGKAWGKTQDFFDRTLNSPIDSDALSSFNIAQFAPLEDREAIYTALATRRTGAANARSLSLTRLRADASYTPAGERAAYEQELAVQTPIAQGIAAGETGLATGNAAIALTAGDVARFVEAVDALKQAAEAQQKITEASNRAARVR